VDLATKLPAERTKLNTDGDDGDDDDDDDGDAEVE